MGIENSSAQHHQSQFERTERKNAASKRKGMGSRAGRFWKESKNAEPHSLPVTTGEHVFLRPVMSCAFRMIAKAPNNASNTGLLPLRSAL